MVVNQILVPRQNVKSHKFEDGMVVYVHDEDRFFSLDAVGADIWQLICKHGSFEAVLKHMTEIYETDESTLRQDIESLCKQLTDLRIIDIKEESQRRVGIKNES